MALETQISLVLPFYNEEEGAREVIQSLEAVFNRSGLTYEMVLVENGSRDSTGTILNDAARQNSRLKVVTVPINQGYGWGIIKGLEAAQADFVGYLCADGQIIPDDVLKVAQCAFKNPHAVSKVKRVSRYDGWRRRIVSWVYNVLFSFVFGVDDEDVNGTPEIFKKKWLESFALESKDWFIDAELMIKAARMNLPVVDVPVEFHTRQAGHSNVRVTTIGEFLRNILLCRLKGAYRSWKISPL